ncbi:hypothetical protein L596_012308 [Steinernema carpocapsae]|uniref:Centriolar and ciliogenesis-associated protein HYLS1 C-terminal domain-containing protein n=1 Tax=Steinernema carpocapsae TaxID=34508 RepID=A0A4U5NWW7_STECR|nr:hypothetical protein L596_012308 [Steinernema carpocapsae]
MSLLSDPDVSDEELDDDDIIRVIQEMGYEVPEGFHLTIPELDATLSHIDPNDSLFGDLINNDFMRTGSFCNPPTLLGDPENISLADTTSLSQKQEDYIKKLIYQGYQCLNRMVSEMEYIDGKLAEWNAPKQASEDAPIVIGSQNAAAPFQEVNGNSAELRARRPPPPPPPHPALRPVPIDKRAPGQAAYRHDPVTLYHMYAKEWMENPPPGTKKRLALRWKVREYMMRKDAPVFKLRPPQNYVPQERKPWIN